MKDIVIVAAKRTAIGDFLGSLANIPAPDLGSIVIKNLLETTGVKPEQVSEVIMGNVLTAGLGQNPARQAAMKAGIPSVIPALTINQVCGSGLKAIELGVQAIKCGDAEIVIAGGQENMSLAPHLLAKVRSGHKMGNMNLVDSMIHDGLSDAYNHYHMGITAENVAQKFNVSREEQDMLAASSQNKAEKARNEGKFKDEIVPVTIPQRKGEAISFMEDEFIRNDATVAGLAKLKPAFKPDGTVTAGNASGINDGAAAVMLMSAEMAKQLNLEPLAYIKSYASVGLDPEIMGVGPVHATEKALEIAGWKVAELDLIEANEAFAAQAVAVGKLLDLDPRKVNVNGGAIALGHPIGASGCRILVTLIHEMKRQGAKKGLATLCIGGGMGNAMTVYRP